MLRELSGAKRPSEKSTVVSDRLRVDKPCAVQLRFDKHHRCPAVDRHYCPTGVDVASRIPRDDRCASALNARMVAKATKNANPGPALPLTIDAPTSQAKAQVRALS